MYKIRANGCLSVVAKLIITAIYTNYKSVIIDDEGIEHRIVVVHIGSVLRRAEAGNNIGDGSRGIR